MINRYSLADYTITISNFPTDTLAGTAELQIGGAGTNGEGSFLGSVIVERNNDLWTTAGDYTGSWVHNQNLDRTGKITIQLNQLSDDSSKLRAVAQAYDLANAPIGCNIVITKGQQSVAVGTDCYLTRLPNLSLEGTAGMRSWVWTCGKLDILG